MNKWMIGMLVAFVTMALWPVDQADARRFGGGSSFGSHHRSFGGSHAKQPSHATSRSSSSRSAAAGNSRPRSGFMGAMAGLAMGGLLGAMFFGGAFSGINMMDILLIGGIALGLIWWFRRKAQGLAQQGFGQPASAGGNGQHAYRAESDGEPYDMPQQGGGTTGFVERPQMDEAVFLDAARTIFVRMQAAWDQQDVEDIRRFCLPDVVAHVEQEMAGDQQHQTEVVTLEGKIVDSWIESGREWAAVAFTAMMKEQTRSDDGGLLQDESQRVQEVWTFCHDQDSKDPTWYVAGIAQEG
ncbi:MAG: TIM44-like domain-containing protein [Mariprofundales bacterium]